MTNVQLYKKNQNIVKVKVFGHSGYAEAGSDIVCASISSLAEALIVGIIEVLKIDAKSNIDEKEASLEISLPEDLSEMDLEKTQILFKTFEVSVKGVAKEYPKYIKIKEIK